MKVLIAIVLCLAMVTVCEAKGLFFEDWTIKETVMAPQGLIQAIFVNPDPKGDIPAVVAIIHPTMDIIAYWYFERGVPKMFFLNNKKQFESGPIQPCKDCHFKAI